MSKEIKLELSIIKLHQDVKELARDFCQLEDEFCRCTPFVSFVNNYPRDFIRLLKFLRGRLDSASSFLSQVESVLEGKNKTGEV